METLDQLLHKAASTWDGTIDSFWYHRAKNASLMTHNIPGLFQEIVINFGDEFGSAYEQQSHFYSKEGSVAGISITPYKTVANGDYQAIGVILKPTSFYRLFGFNSNALNGKPVFKISSVHFSSISKVIFYTAVLLDGLWFSESIACFSGSIKFHL